MKYGVYRVMMNSETAVLWVANL